MADYSERGNYTASGAHVREASMQGTLSDQTQELIAVRDREEKVLRDIINELELAKRDLNAAQAAVSETNYQLTARKQALARYQPEYDDLRAENAKLTRDNQTLREYVTRVQNVVADKEDTW